MIRLAAFTFVLALVATGCRTAENVASTSAAVVTVTSSTSTSPPSQQEETRPSTARTPRPSAAPRSSSSNVATQFPVAKPVPGKPGYVFSPYDPNGGYVDVTGYQSGSKVKDPYSQKIFLVP
jgi:hypothetical protein